MNNTLTGTMMPPCPPLSVGFNCNNMRGAMAQTPITPVANTYTGNSPVCCAANAQTGQHGRAVATGNNFGYTMRVMCTINGGCDMSFITCFDFGQPVNTNPPACKLPDTMWPQCQIPTPHTLAPQLCQGQTAYACPANRGIQPQTQPVANTYTGNSPVCCANQVQAGARSFWCPIQTWLFHCPVNPAPEPVPETFFPRCASQWQECPILNINGGQGTTTDTTNPVTIRPQCPTFQPLCFPHQAPVAPAIPQQRGFSWIFCPQPSWFHCPAPPMPETQECGVSVRIGNCPLPNQGTGGATVVANTYTGNSPVCCAAPMHNPMTVANPPHCNDQGLRPQAQTQVTSPQAKAAITMPPCNIFTNNIFCVTQGCPKPEPNNESRIGVCTGGFGQCPVWNVGGNTHTGNTQATILVGCTMQLCMTKPPVCPDVAPQAAANFAAAPNTLDGYFNTRYWWCPPPNPAPNSRVGVCTGGIGQCPVWNVGGGGQAQTPAPVGHVANTYTGNSPVCCAAQNAADASWVFCPKPSWFVCPAPVPVTDIAVCTGGIRQCPVLRQTGDTLTPQAAPNAMYGTGTIIPFPSQECVSYTPNCQPPLEMMAAHAANTGIPRCVANNMAAAQVPPAQAAACSIDNLSWAVCLTPSGICFSGMCPSATCESAGCDQNNTIWAGTCVGKGPCR